MSNFDRIVTDLLLNCAQTEPRNPVIRWESEDKTSGRARARQSTGGYLRRLRIGIIDIVSRGPTRALYARIMNASLASIMPQVIGVWCKEEGHEVTFVCYTGFEDLLAELPDNVDVVFIGAFTEAAHTAHALSNLFRGRGAITVIGGPHAR